MHRFYMNGGSGSNEGAEGMLICILALFALLLAMLPVVEVIGAIRFIIGKPLDEAGIFATQLIGIPAFFMGSSTFEYNILEYLNEGKERKLKRIFVLIKAAIIVLAVVAVLLLEVCPIITGIVDIIFTIFTTLCVVGAIITSM